MLCVRPTVFSKMVDNSNIEKLTKPSFPGKFIFAQIWAKRAQNDSKIGFFYFLKNFIVLVFLEIIENEN